MSAEAQQITCPGCGEVFIHFLQEIADHNEKVVCPACGKVIKVDSGRRSSAASANRDNKC
jgi:predicted RNA-binding Zn-ribbon protein involved in translation (DUF1610 family)